MFSRRLAWGVGENPLGALEARVRAEDGPLFDLTSSNPTRVGLPARGSAIAAALADSAPIPAIAEYLPHPLGLPTARAAVAGEYARQGAVVDPDHIVLTASSSESYAWLLKLLCDPGDVVLVPEPSYPLFDYLAGLEGVVARRYQLAFDGDWHIDWPSLTAALPGARALIVVNPNNPTGSFISRADWQRLAALAAAHEVALIADEVFADYAFAPADDAVITVAAEAAPPALTFVLGGLSKAAGLPQLKLGWVALLGPAALAQAARARLELIADSYLSVGTPVARALPALLAVGADLRRDLRARVDENRALLSSTLGRDLPISWIRGAAGWSAILRVPAVRSDEAWALALLEEDRVLVQPGYFFDLASVPGLGATLVVSLLTPPATFATGLQHIIARAARF
jgi:alanine-synthesizing transaminase